MAANYKDCAKALGIGKEVEEYLGGTRDIDDAVFKKNLEEKTREAMRDAYLRKLEVYNRNQYIQHVNRYNASRKKPSEFRAAVAFLTQDDRRTGRASIEEQVRAVEDHFLHNINASISAIDDRTFRQKLFQSGSIVDSEFGENIVRELMVPSGKARPTGDINASKVAKIFNSTFEEIRTQYNRAGGFIQKLDDWALPQLHNKVKMAGRKVEWAKFTAARLDLHRMNLTLQEAEDMLLGANGKNSVYDTIMTDGASKHDRDHLPVISAAKVANRYGEHRALHFKDAESWIEYQKKFGEEDYVGSMVKHVKNMSRDLGLIRAMGPNPQAMFNDMLRRVNHEHLEAQAKTGKRPRYNGSDNLQAVWANINGMGAVSDGIAQWAGGVRDVMSAAKLGGAVLSSIPDVAAQAATAFFTGTGQGRWARHWIKQMTPWLAGESKARAQRMGLMLDQVLLDFTESSRYADQEYKNIARGLSNATYKASLMVAWDRANRTAFKLSMVDALSTAPSKIDKMNPRMRAMLERYGITQDDWAKIRLAKDAAEAGMINPAKMPLPMYQKFMSMVNSETNVAVVRPTARTQAITNRGLAPGTVAGEGFRFMWQWKTFPVAYFQTHMTRMAGVFTGRHGDSPGFRAAYIGQYITTATALGIFSVQVKEISKGREPFNPDSPEEWATLVRAGMAQAGIGGLFYEAVFGALANGRSPATVLLPPALSLFDDLLLRSLFANDDDVTVLDGQIQKNLGRAGVRALGWVPGQSIWYIRAMWDQLLTPAVADQISEAELERFDRRNRRLKRERDQGRWLEVY